MLDRNMNTVALHRLIKIFACIDRAVITSIKMASTKQKTSLFCDIMEHFLQFTEMNMDEILTFVLMAYAKDKVFISPVADTEILMTRIMDALATMYKETVARHVTRNTTSLTHE